MFAVIGATFFGVPEVTPIKVLICGLFFTDTSHVLLEYFKCQEIVLLK